MIQGVLAFNKVHIHLFHFTVLNVPQALEVIGKKERKKERKKRKEKKKENFLQK